MSKTSKTTYKNNENEKKKGKKSYQERLIQEKEAQESIKKDWPYPPEELSHDEIFLPKGFLDHE